MHCESGEGIAVLSVPHGYSEVSSEGSGGDDKQVFFLRHKKAFSNGFSREVQVPHKGKCWTHTHTDERSDNSGGLVWRQPLGVSFLSEEPNFYQYRFGLLWENSSWPCSHSSLWASQGLVNRLHKFPCLYALQPPPPPPATNTPYPSFIRNATEKSKPQLYSRSANSTFEPHKLVWTFERHSEAAYIKLFIKKEVILSFLPPDCLASFPFSRSERCSVSSGPQRRRVRAKLIWGRVAFRAPCGPFYGHVSARLALIGQHGEPGLDRCLEEGHLFGHVLI